MSKKASKKSASKQAPTTEEVANSAPVSSTPVVEAQAAASVGTAGHMEAIREEARQLDGAERRTSFETAAPEEEKPEPKDEPTEITVKYRDYEGKELERTYSKDVHGEGFKTLAEEFKKVNASRIVTS